MPILLATAQAVSLWSPVIITVFIPAFLQVTTAFLASFLGGSIIPISPKNIRPFSDLVEKISSLQGLYAKASTRSPLLAISLLIFSILPLLAEVIGRILSPSKIPLHFSIKTSQPPFAITK